MTTLTDLDKKVRTALKEKWMNNDHDINLGKMVAWSGASEADLLIAIYKYESELLCTKFNIVR